MIELNRSAPIIFGSSWFLNLFVVIAMVADALRFIRLVGERSEKVRKAG